MSSDRTESSARRAVKTIHVRRKTVASTWNLTVGQSTQWHAIELGSNELVHWQTAACGFKPNHPWAEEIGRKVTCGRCLAKLSERSGT